MQGQAVSSLTPKCGLSSREEIPVLGLTDQIERKNQVVSGLSPGPPHTAPSVP